MKVLQLCSHYIGTPLYKLLFSELEKLDIKLDVFVPIKKGKKPSFDIPNNAYIVECYSDFNRLFFYLKQKKIFSFFKEHYNVYNYDIIHAHTLFSDGFLAYKISKRTNKKYIVAIRNTDINVFLKYFFFLRKAADEIIKNAEKVIFINPSYKDIYKTKYLRVMDGDIFDQKCVIIPNGIDNFWLENRSADLRKFDKDLIRLIYVGIITREKNVTTTVKACKILRKQGYKIIFRVIGREINKKILKKIRRNQFVEVISQVDKEKLITYYRNSDIFVMPSFTETFGLVYAEALSQGLPIIYTKGQGFDRQFPEGYVGFHVDPHDPKDIADKILSIYKNYRNVSANTNLAVMKFKWERIARIYYECYHEII
jgi:glycosyltransferase involved in cell wall biosynthesis